MGSGGGVGGGVSAWRPVTYFISFYSEKDFPLCFAVNTPQASDYLGFLLR